MEAHFLMVGICCNTKDDQMCGSFTTFILSYCIANSESQTMPFIMSKKSTCDSNALGLFRFPSASWHSFAWACRSLKQIFDLHVVSNILVAPPVGSFLLSLHFAAWVSTPMATGRRCCCKAAWEIHTALAAVKKWWNEVETWSCSWAWHRANQLPLSGDWNLCKSWCFFGKTNSDLCHWGTCSKPPGRLIVWFLPLEQHKVFSCWGSIIHGNLPQLVVAFSMLMKVIPVPLAWR